MSGREKRFPLKPGVRPRGGGKVPREAVSPGSYHGLHPSWRFGAASRMPGEVRGARFGGLPLLREDAGRILPKLSGLESMTWRDILVTGKKGNHSIPVKDLSREAVRLLRERQKGLEEVVSLRFGSTERLFGKIDPLTGTFEILFWDPGHEVCPSGKKHT